MSPNGAAGRELEGGSPGGWLEEQAVGQDISSQILPLGSGRQGARQALRCPLKQGARVEVRVEVGQEIQLGRGEAASRQQVPLCSCCPGRPRACPHHTAHGFPGETRTFRGSPGFGIPRCSPVLRAGAGLVPFATISPAPSTEPGTHQALPAALLAERMI